MRGLRLSKSIQMLGPRYLQLPGRATALAIWVPTLIVGTVGCVGGGVIGFVGGGVGGGRWEVREAQPEEGWVALWLGVELGRRPPLEGRLPGIAGGYWLSAHRFRGETRMKYLTTFASIVLVIAWVILDRREPFRSHVWLTIICPGRLP